MPHAASPSPAVRAIMADGRIRIERATLGRMLAGGLDADLIALLVHAHAVKGSTTALRILERASCAAVDIVLERPFDHLGVPDRSWDDQPYAAATVEISHGLGWREGSLYDALGAIPATMAQAAIGRPIGDVILHPDIDPSSTVLGANEGPVTLRVNPEIIDLPLPRSPAARLRALGMRVAARRTEKVTERQVRWALTGSFLVATLSFSMRFLWPTSPGYVSHIVSGMPVGVMIVTGLLSVDAHLGRILTDRLLRWRGSTSHYEDSAARLHRKWLWEQRDNRGFDEEGHPTS